MCYCFCLNTSRKNVSINKLNAQDSSSEKCCGSAACLTALPFGTFTPTGVLCLSITYHLDT